MMSVEATYRTFSAGENIISARTVHSIGIHLGSATHLFQKRAGKKVNRIFAPDDIVIVPAGIDNYCVHDVPIEGLYIDVSTEVVSQIALQLDLDPDHILIRTTFGSVDPIIVQLGNLIHRETNSDQLGGALYHQALVQQLTVHLLRQYTDRPTSKTDITLSTNEARQRILPALDIIHAHLTDDLSLDLLASATHLTSYYFLRVFKQATGITPHQYVLKERVERAKFLLHSTEKTISEIALQVGFSDQSHLHRHFKRLVGATPRQYRQQMTS